VFRNAAYFLWKDGVYRWDSEGVVCLSDGKGRDGKGGVRSWFASDNYFNRDMYPFAFAEIDPNRPCFRLFLCSAGSTTIDRWVEYDINGGTWWGPHKTGLFTPSCAFTRTDAASHSVAVVGGGTAVYGDSVTRTDGAATAIDASAISNRHHFGDPDREKFFGQPSVMFKAQSSGTLLVKARVGAVNQTTVTLSQGVDLTRTRQRLERLGHGLHAQIELANAEVGVDAEVYAYTIDPTRFLGRR